MNRYENGKIYKIVDVGFNKCYIGSTCEKLCKRMERHRNSYRKYLRTGEMETRCHLLFDEFGVENCRIILIEDYVCKSKEELFRKEGEHINATKCLNRSVAGRTREEHKAYHREEILERERQYQKKRYLKKKEEIKEQVKKYQVEHREDILQKKREHYQENKDNIRARQTRPFNCDCGSVCQWNVKGRHFKSQKHQDWLKQQEEI